MQINELVDLLVKADIEYYRNGTNSSLSDAQYDALKNQLRESSPDHQYLSQVGLPVAYLNASRKKVRHNIPMGSLDNTDNGIAGFEPWLKNLFDQAALPPIMASLKMDGSSICATYENGKLVRVATRGNGEYGEDVTSNGALFKGLPVILPEPWCDTLNIDVRGEAVLYKEDFLKVCEEEGIPEEERSNPRNVGNGIVNREDGTNSNLIHFVAFNVEGLPVESEQDKFELLRKLGFGVVEHRLCDTPEDFLAYYHECLARRQDLPFEIDGIVVCVNKVEQQLQFVTPDIKSRLRPKYARAVKFPHLSNNTKLVGCTITVGHTGAIIPTAVVETVRVGGVNVSNVLLNNWDEIDRLGICIGDTVEVILSGDIIPKIIRLVEKGIKREPIAEPTACPCCGSSTTRVLRGKPGAVTFCTNAKCDQVIVGKIKHWIGSSKKGVGILGFGDKTIEAMTTGYAHSPEEWLVNDPADLYCLTVEQLADLDLVTDGKIIRVGESRAQMIYDNIQAKRELPLHVFLGALGIELLGSRRVLIMQKEAKGRLDRLKDWLDIGLLETIDLPGFGEAIREAVIAGIEDNRALIQKLLSNGVTIVEAKSKQGDSTAPSVTTGSTDKPFAGISFCLTGTRKFITEIEALGGEVKSGVSKGLTFLVQADPLSTSTKTQKAEKYGTKIISIDCLEKAVGGSVQLTSDGCVVYPTDQQ
jgi:DNA ligase (NAD+)